MNKQTLTQLLSMFMSKYVTRQDITKYFTMGDKFTEDELSKLLRLLPFDSKDGLFLSDLVDFLI